jgi:lipoate-protein ligase B
LAPQLNAYFSVVEMIKVLNLLEFGYQSYGRCWNLQKLLAERCLQSRLAGKPENFLIFVEHFPVYTLGKGGSMEHLKASNNSMIPLYRIERGGNITWHGPGQLIAYPVFDLMTFKKDLHWYSVFNVCSDQKIGVMFFFSFLFLGL